ncbi:carboxypeptidase-like regulatory domain-containing protein [Pontibacter sp. HSC-14F20]|uniref:carboxypeptidase-like regulatory domain-containing protein n=1 Tax=Pontibacter sp. HSC-14F20 TaxID=2864136 RepID=UPI001C737A0B|nr:carboxypeptidase-like regulatory domain-containing protein [Pontibacter sp. HSC-14F20]MBX0333402.1 carboxypeptidase-like regulatory domain-containing protein [Pontibacter sp. HSC-14F20]
MKTRFAYQYFLLLTLAIGLGACTNKEDDYLSKYCPGSCTEISGQVLRGNGQPMANVQLSATWRDMHYLSGGTIRKKAVAYTDDSGRYTLRLLVRDDEINNGHFEVQPYGVSCSQSACPSFNFFWEFEFKRDTTFTHDFVID